MVDIYDCSDCCHCEDYSIECDHPWVQCDQKPRNKRNEFPKTKFRENAAQCDSFLSMIKTIAEAQPGDSATAILSLPQRKTGIIKAVYAEAVDIEYDHPIVDRNGQIAYETRVKRFPNTQIVLIRRSW